MWSLRLWSQVCPYPIDSLLVILSSLDFRNRYATLGANIAAFGGPDWTDSAGIGQNDGKFGSGIKRSSVKGSPVVPNSLKKVHEEGESVMFSVTILRGHYEAGQYVDGEFVPGRVFTLCVDVKIFNMNDRSE